MKAKVRNVHGVETKEWVQVFLVDDKGNKIGIKGKNGEMLPFHIKIVKSK